MLDEHITLSKASVEISHTHFTDASPEPRLDCTPTCNKLDYGLHCDIR